MTREEAVSTLNQLLTTLALNSVHNKRLLEYADDLDRYIAYLDKEAEEAKATETKTEEAKAEEEPKEETSEPEAN